MTSEIEKVIFEMLTESTGTHFLDSGGGSGRHWQHNQKRTIVDFQNEPDASLILEPDYPEAEISVFHFLTSGAFQLDDTAQEFNALDCDDWHGDFYGTSADQCAWLEDHGLSPTGQGWNTYNHAQLFRIDDYCDCSIFETAMFSASTGPGFDEYTGVDWYSGEWINHEGMSADDDDWSALRDHADLTTASGTKMLHGDIQHSW